MAAPRSILVILGPTAAGKSDLALALARRTRAEILSVDSMQVYQEMDIGTAKPSLPQRYEIPHYLIDWVRPDEAFSAARYVELADEVIAQSAALGVPLIAVGGTPLYYKALFEGLFDGPGADAAFRAERAGWDSAVLHTELVRVDPVAAARIHPADRKRLVRALEVFHLTGQPISSIQQQWDAPKQRHPAIWIGLRWDKAILNQRINARVKDMLAAGWLQEVARLLQRYPNLSQTAAEATGYGQLIDCLAGRCTLEEAAEQIKIATRQLARKQMKWFKRFPGVHWLAGEAPLAENVEAALRLWQA